jgi:hypothetical protein
MKKKPAVVGVSMDNKRYRIAGILCKETGATGLEPTTSGVTDRYGLNRHNRLRPRFWLEQAFRTRANRL